ncbi:MAG: MBL fold metallo-hydrolase [Archaeoglobaceae archaeon]
MVVVERIESAGLSHYSYLIGDSGEAVVIDPRLDYDPYLDLAYEEGFRISHILETHRNEDYVVGSLQLACMTGAEIWHADSQWDYKYGNQVLEKHEWEIGDLKLKAILTPGHTPGSMSYLLHDPEGNPWMLFTGDVLFAGDVGRVDLLGPEKMEEMAGQLYDTLFNKILPLGDGIIVCPAHGSGSVCGSAIAERTWTTIGLEKTSNPALQCKDKTEFVSGVSRQLEMPPYFKMMEKMNLNPQPELPLPPPLKPEEFEERAKEAIILDTRNEVEFGGAHIINSLSIWLEGLPTYAGWFLPYGVPILLVTGKKEDALDAVRYLARIGYNNVVGYLSRGMHGWHMAGKESDSTDTILVQELCRRLDDGEPTWILDVRSDKELQEVGYIPRAHHIHITQLSQRMDEVPKDQNRVYIFCGSSLRSTTAASILKRNGWENITVVLGGIAGWNSITCPIKNLKDKQK